MTSELSIPTIQKVIAYGPLVAGFVTVCLLGAYSITFFYRRSEKFHNSQLFKLYLHEILKTILIKSIYQNLRKTIGYKINPLLLPLTREIFGKHSKTYIELNQCRDSRLGIISKPLKVRHGKI